MRIVVKVGTSTLAHETGRLNIRHIEKLVKVLSDLKNSGHEIILVSSGAIGMGVGKLMLANRPNDMPTKQAAAAIGQCELMYTYDKLFSEYNHTVAQILLTKEDVEQESRRVNFQNTLYRLLELNALPIVNENDTISTSEISVGDNDTLGAIVSCCIKADLLILLSDIEGLYTDDPHQNKNAKLIPIVQNLDEDIMHLGKDKGSMLGTGGMVTKLQAAKIVTDHGIDMIICHGSKPENLYDILEGKRIGTYFYGKGSEIMNTQEILIQAKRESNKAPYSTEEKNTALKAMAKALIDHTDEILSKNKIDIENARNKISEVMLDRLYLDASRIQDMAKGILDVSKLPDPTGRILSTHTLENGLIVNKISVPMGVIAIIYESRPNVTSDAAALTIKAGSVCILRSGKEAWNSANAIVKALREGLENVGMSKNRIHLIEDTTRQSSYDLMKANGYVDLLIPRGGKGLIQSVIQNATVPCIETGTGICHIYVDKDANLDKAVKIIENAKTQRPSVCNAEEVCLVHKDIAQDFLPNLKEVLVEQRKAQDKIPVELRLDPIAHQIIDGTLATDEDFDTEFLDYILAIKVVDSIEEAIEHIQEHSTHHSDAIISENEKAQTKFSSTIDSAAVYINASTRFTDGGVFGLGCEMGISTQKLHARGPMGLEELCTYKYIIKGNGQIRE